MNGSWHVMVTGPTGGIGQALARAFAGKGHRLSLVGRRRSALQALAGELVVETHVAEVDLARLGGGALGWLQEAEAALGPVDVLVNNAGSVLAGRFVDVSNDEAHQLVEVDLLAPLLLSRAVLPGMLQRRQGTVVNIASTGALAPSPGMVHYCAAKAGLAAASESLRGELRGTGVRVVTVYPGPILTAMLQAAHAGYPPSRRVSGLPAGTPEELARRVRSAVERGSPRVIYPRLYTPFRYFPGVIRWMLDRLTPPPLARQLSPGRSSWFERSPTRSSTTTR